MPRLPVRGLGSSLYKWLEPAIGLWLLSASIGAEGVVRFLALGAGIAFVTKAAVSAKIIPISGRRRNVWLVAMLVLEFTLPVALFGAALFIPMGTLARAAFVAGAGYRIVPLVVLILLLRSLGGIGKGGKRA